MTGRSGHADGHALKGIGLVMLAVIIFSLSDVTGKYLFQTHAVPFVIAVRYGVNLLILAVFVGARHGTAVLRTQKTGLVLVRAGSLALASLAMGLALKRMPVGETVAIIYLSPFAVMLLAAWLLGEKPVLASWVGALVGFSGVLLIVRPGAGLDPAGVGFALLAAAATVAYHLLSRQLAQTETTLSMLFYTALVGTVVFGAMLPWGWDGRVPNLHDGVLLLALGVFATVGHALFTAAYREAPASLLAPVNYLALVWAALFGWIVFDHAPDWITLIGMALIVIAGMAVALRQHFHKT